MYTISTQTLGLPLDASQCPWVRPGTKVCPLCRTQVPYQLPKATCKPQSGRQYLQRYMAAAWLQTFTQSIHSARACEQSVITSCHVQTCAPNHTEIVHMSPTLIYTLKAKSTKARRPPSGHHLCSPPKGCTSRLSDSTICTQLRPVWSLPGGPHLPARLTG